VSKLTGQQFVLSGHGLCRCCPGLFTTDFVLSAGEISCAVSFLPAFDSVSSLRAGLESLRPQDFCFRRSSVSTELHRFPALPLSPAQVLVARGSRNHRLDFRPSVQRLLRLVVFCWTVLLFVFPQHPREAQRVARSSCARPCSFYHRVLRSSFSGAVRASGSRSPSRSCATSFHSSLTACCSFLAYCSRVWLPTSLGSDC
jgi:hypothetical protein